MVPVCPICNKAKAKTLFCYDDLSIWKCPCCGLIYKFPRQDSYQNKCIDCKDRCVERIYDDKFFNYRVALEKRRFERIKRLINSDFSGLRVLEVGTGVGALGALINAESLEYWGTEPVQFFYQKIMGNSFSFKNRVINALLPEGKFENYFDVIVAIDVLQFVSDPPDFLDKLSSYLKKNGKLYFELPNETLMGLRSNIRKMLKLYSSSPIHPGHVNFFNKYSLRYLLNKADFRAINLFQVSIAGDKTRFFLTFKKRIPLFLDLFLFFLKITKLDLIFQQGNLICIAGKSRLR